MALPFGSLTWILQTITEIPGSVISLAAFRLSSEGCSGNQADSSRLPRSGNLSYYEAYLEVHAMTRAFAALLIVTGVGAHAQSADMPEFEVASIRPAPPMGTGPVSVACTGGPGTKDPGLFTCQNMSLSNLVLIAYHLDYFRLSAPDWMTPMLMFNISAKIPPNTTREQFELMMQRLLADRFKLSVHHENREMTQLSLVVAKNGPKFREAAETSPPKGGGDEATAAVPPVRPTLDKDGFPAFTGRPMSTFMNGKARLYQPRMKMQALAGSLQNQVRAPVTDATGLTGEYEINLYWVTDAGLRAHAPADRGGDPQADDVAGPTLTQALQEQLGLRLEPKKGQVDFVVVDHAERVPTQN
jgi:uncharacterized protein (TIGR03435 family)